jgi:hypothetical protein
MDTNGAMYSINVNNLLHLGQFLVNLHSMSDQFHIPGTGGMSFETINN